MKIQKEDIIKDIQRVAKTFGVKSLKSKDFLKNSNYKLGSIRYHFETWNNALIAAGLEPVDPNKIINEHRIEIKDDLLLKDLIRLYNEYGKEPTQDLINSKGKYSTKPYRKRWKTISNAFLIAKINFGIEIKSEVSKEEDEKKNYINVKIIPETIKPKSLNKPRVVFGEPINFRGLRFAPINEQGVVYLFGMISHELGFLIESIRTSYPDCEGKRCFDKDKNQWEHVQIEFEYCSSNFLQHGHDEKICDVIVCWVHDWKECPIEVLELKSVIRYLSN
ncbi:MAG: hypothetical protein HY959_07580 [Ignavibacteriae bacterium]|nr:hypothetical protein [Ignavibacteriota bacterium]